MRSILKHILPDFLIAHYKAYKRKRKESRLLAKKNSNTIITQEHLIDDFKKAGITSNDSILVHSSLSKIGYVEGGAMTVIQALRTCVGENGTLLFPAFPFVGYSKDLLEQNSIFNYTTTPSAMGIISETFRKLPDVHRSLHPTDSVCAQGPLADYYTNEHFGQLTPYNKLSPFYKLCADKGKLLLIGVKLDSLTNLHTLEDAVNFKYPVYDKKNYTATLRDKHGNLKTMSTKVHDPAWSKKRRCNDLMPVFIEHGVMKSVMIGEAESYVIDAFQMHELMVKLYLEKGITMYTPFGS